MTGRMRRLAPAFRKTGWQVTELEPGHANAIRWRICPAPHAEKSREDAREPSHGSQPAGSASDASERERSSGTSSHGGEKKSAAQPCAKCGGPLDQSPDPLPSVAMVRKARRSSTLACGHHVHPGHVIVKRAGRWRCLECALAAIRATMKGTPPCP